MLCFLIPGQTLDFSFAISVNLMKGLKHHVTASATTSTLELLLDLESKYSRRSVVSEDLELRRIGYLVPLLPLVAKKSSLLWLAGIKEDIVDLYRNSNRDSEWTSESAAENFRQIIQQIQGDMSISTLAVSTAAAMLEYTENETEIMAIYQFLLEAAEHIPDIFLLM